MTLLMWFAIVMVIVTFYLVIKRFDPRTVFFVSGLIMCLVTGQFLQPFDKFLTTLFTGGTTQIICAAMGYAYLMSFTQCDKHLATLLMRGIKKVRALLIPGVIIAGGLIITALGSNAGSAAAIGPIVVPVLIKAGIHPAFAATTLAVAVHGDYFMIGTHGAIIGAIAGTDAATVVMNYMWPAGLVIYALAIVYMLVLGRMKKESSGFIDTEGQFQEATEEVDKINYYKAFMPFLAIIIILLSTKKILPKMNVQQCMLIASVWGLLTLRANVAEGVKAVMVGYGRGLADVVTIIAAAAVFIQGMTNCGLITALIKAMQANPSIAIYSAAFAPAFIAFLGGSGDAAALAFHAAITPHVAAIGLNPSAIGSLASMCGSMGRTMSPVAGVTIISAGFAKINPIEVTKRVWPYSIISVLVLMIILGFIMG